MRPTIHLLLLLLIVPFQLLISHWMTPSAVERSKRIQSLTQWLSGIGMKFKKWTASLKDFESWRNVFQSALRNPYKRRTTSKQKRKQSDPEHIDSIEYKRDSNLEGQSHASPAHEVLKFDSYYDQYVRKQWQPSPKEEHFAYSDKVRLRSKLDRKVKFRIGQVVKHKLWGYRGVIVGWDEFAKAPESWLRANHPTDRPEWRTQPNYAILVHTGDRLDPQITYVPEENIEIISNTKISHPSLKNYFNEFDGSQYLPSKKLKKLYPED